MHIQPLRAQLVGLCGRGNRSVAAPFVPRGLAVGCDFVAGAKEVDAALIGADAVNGVVVVGYGALGGEDVGVEEGEDSDLERER